MEHWFLSKGCLASLCGSFTFLGSGCLYLQYGTCIGGQLWSSPPPTHTPHHAAGEQTTLRQRLWRSALNPTGIPQGWDSKAFWHRWSTYWNRTSHATLINVDGLITRLGFSPVIWQPVWASSVGLTSESSCSKLLSATDLTRSLSLFIRVLGKQCRMEQCEL